MGRVGVGTVLQTFPIPPGNLCVSRVGVGFRLVERRSLGPLGMRMSMAPLCMALCALCVVLHDAVRRMALYAACAVLHEAALYVAVWRCAPYGLYQFSSLSSTACAATQRARALIWKYAGGARASYDMPGGAGGGLGTSTGPGSGGLSLGFQAGIRMDTELSKGGIPELRAAPATIASLAVKFRAGRRKRRRCRRLTISGNRGAGLAQYRRGQ